MVIDCFQFSVMSSNYWVMVNDYVRRRAIRKSKSLSCLLRDEIRRAVLLRKMLMSCKSEFSSWPTTFVWAVACNRLWRGGWKLDGLLLCYLQCVLSLDQWRGIHVIIGHVTLCESHTSPFTVRCLKQNAFFILSLLLVPNVDPKTVNVKHCLWVQFEYFSILRSFQIRTAWLRY